MKKTFLGLALLFFASAILAQTRTITGKVTDDKGSPLSNISVIVKGTSIGATTNATGNYSLTVPLSAKTLTFSGINFTDTDAEITGDVVNLTLETTGKVLDEVVVTGVGTATSKKKVAFSVETVSAKDLPKVPQGSIDQALVGKIPGAQISSISGQPGQQAAILLRGINTLSTTQPMILVDGV
ncbi:MAG TPA: carboxypeptidase-like regulatory domain-containing protein, partial [Chitinophagaceae bacterium]|nr:carboxypeptidase-like regulatory domain-containing protein [Chitinophagaceae bacterium]